MTRETVLTICRRPEFWRSAVARDTVVRAIWVSLFIGSILIAINQGDAILSGQIPPVWKIVLTYSVPYLVSTYSAASAQVALVSTQ